ncbi:MAG: hypothetical protein JSW66_02860 [Phycisphaerales bacterium]|nr:MAG: hypothetical protein JSW66_02860 [Phycisphaerales bacterium]
MSFKETVKHYACELGADLIGFGGIDRCKHAPMMMSPQGLFPGAKTIIVMGIHHPDACIELGGETHPQEVGPYSVQYLMNARLDEMSYRMGSFLEQQGYGAVPIVSSNIWRYNQYKDLKSVFAPDVSHIYMSVVAGLTDMGFSGIALSPEYGPRNRFITVITDADIEQDPLIPPGTVCDKCMLCRKHCPTAALAKEIDGDKVLRIGDYEYRFPNKNLWRCAWGEHFDLDLDLEIPEAVTEAVIAENVVEHGVRAGEMGQCLKFCVPKTRRHFDSSYSKSPLRQQAVSFDESLESRSVMDRILSRGYAKGAEYVVVSTAEELERAGIHLAEQLAGAQSAVTVIITRDKKLNGRGVESSEQDFAFAANYLVDSICYDITRDLDELGFRSVMTIRSSGSHVDVTDASNVPRQILATLPGLPEGQVIANTVITHKKIASRCLPVTTTKSGTDAGNAQTTLTTTLQLFAESLGIDLFGVASVERLDWIADQLMPHFEGQEIMVAQDESIRFQKWKPNITVKQRHLMRPGDYIEGAQSVIVFGLRFHKEVVRWATRPPAEAVGPYAFQTYITNWLGFMTAVRLIKRLEGFGYRGVLAADLLNTASRTANPRGPQNDLFSNRFAAVAAGLGYLTASAHAATPEFGIRQCFMAVVTDAPLDASELYTPAAGEYLCADCDKMCMTSCPSKAISTREVTIDCENREYRFNLTDPLLCDWSKRYALLGESGFKYLGSTVDSDPGTEVTVDKLSEGLRQLDPIKKYRPVIAEPCVIRCPYGNEDAPAHQ